MRRALLLALLMLAGCLGRGPSEGGPEPEALPTGPVPDPGVVSELPPPEGDAGSEGAPSPGPSGAAAFQLAQDCPHDCFEPSIATDLLGRTVIAPSYGQPSVGTTDGRSFYALPGVPRPAGSPEGAVSEDGWLVAAPDEARIYWVTFLAQAPPAIHVASTADGGLTWDRNIGLNPAQGQRNVVLVDRPWLGVAPGGVLYLTYNNEGGLWMARSEDGGLTFGPFGPVTQALGNLGGAGAGPPVADSSGRVLVPYFGNPTGPFTPPPVPAEQTMVAVSADGGLTFAHRPVGPAGVFFPVLARGSDDRLHAAWTSERGDVLVATSDDGGTTWSEAVDWSGGRDAVVGPWILAGPGGISVTWFHRTAPNVYDLVLASGDAGPDAVEVVARGLASLPHARRGDVPGTDYSSAAFLGDGRVGMVWGSTRERLLGIGIL